MELVATLDRARGKTFGYLLRIPGSRAIVRHKSRRLAATLALGALPALFFALFLPSFSLIVAPLVLGVPHLAADLRYLVLKPSWPRRVLWLLACGSVLVLGLRTGELFTGQSLARFEIAAVLAWCLGTVLLARGPAPRSFGAALALAALGALGLYAPETARLVLGYAHNLVAIALWLTLFGGAHRASFAALSLVALATLALLCGGAAFLPATQSLFDSRVASLADSFAPASDWFAAPSLPPGSGLGILTSFAFLQSVHYLLWLQVIPGQEVPGERTRSFAQSFRGLKQDFGHTGLLAIAALSMLTLAGLFVAPTAARSSYTSLSTFHGYVEIAIGLHAWLSRPRA